MPELRGFAIGVAQRANNVSEWERARRTAHCRDRFSPLGLSDLNPGPAAPVAVTAARFAPAVMRAAGPSPVVGVDLEPELGAIGRPAAHAPAITLVVAHDCC